MGIDLSEIRKNVEIYFKEHLPQYEVLEIRRKSSHPDDYYLYMVSARKENGTYAVWTSWNENTQSLNHGHHDLASIEDCERIFAEFQNVKPYFEVYKCSQHARFQLFVTESEKSAKNFCEQNHWQLVDENGFVWDLDYCRIDNSDSAYRKQFGDMSRGK